VIAIARSLGSRIDDQRVDADAVDGFVGDAGYDFGVTFAYDDITSARRRRSARITGQP
jgi:hypothetical protein